MVVFPATLWMYSQPILADYDIGYGVPPRDLEMEDISQGVDTIELLDLIEKGEV